MSIKDLREYIEVLDKAGEIQKIDKQVDWNLELGGIIRRTYDLQAPAPLFCNIKDYPSGYRVLGAPVGVSAKPNHFHIRLATSLSMNPTSSATDIIEEYIRRKKNLIKPILVKDGPCKENIHLGSDIDLYEFPAPFVHEGDGGRYLCTWHINITKDPDSGWVNWGMYRAMLHDKTSMGGLFHPNQHIGLHYYSKYEAKGKPMPFAIAMGTEPVSPLIGATFLPIGVNEADVAGAIKGEPIELIKCETVDLEVPATSEIVIEGIIPPYERKEEGPFGEYTGYRTAERAPRPIYKITCITHRNNPILPVSCMGVPIDDSAASMPIIKSAEILDELRSKNLPVKMVYSPTHGGTHFLAVSTKVPYHSYPMQLAHTIWASPAGRGSYFLVIVEDDVDVTNINEVIWALTTRCHPDRGIVKDTKGHGHPLVPFLNAYERKNYMGAAVFFDCTWPKDWPADTIPVKSSFDVLWPKDIQEKILSNWENYGFKKS